MGLDTSVDPNDLQPLRDEPRFGGDYKKAFRKADKAWPRSVRPGRRIGSWLNLAIRPQANTRLSVSKSSTA